MQFRVGEERLAASVGLLHGTAEPERGEAQVDLERDVLPPAEGTTHPGQHDPYERLRQREGGRDLPTISVHVLRRNVQRHSTVGVRERQRRFRSEERLVLPSGLPSRRDDDRRRALGGCEVTLTQVQAPVEVPVRMEPRSPLSRARSGSASTGSGS